MKKLLQMLKNERFITGVMVIVALAVGISVGSFWIITPNGMAIDGNKLRPGKYLVQYPDITSLSAPVHIPAGDVPGGPPWKVILVVYDWGVGDRLVAIPSEQIEWQNGNASQSPTLWVSIVDGKKKFVYWFSAPVLEGPGIIK